MNAEELAVHVERMLPDTDVLPMERLARDLAPGCVDGRNPGCVAGAPGGSAGLLVLLLASLEEVRGRPLTRGEVDTLFAQYRRHFERFYLHSDQPALIGLGRALHALEGEPGWPDDSGAIEALVRAPPAALRSRLLDLLVVPAHVGCGHLRLLLSEPHVYRARPELTIAVIQAFFEALWDGDPAMILDILPGDHREEAVIQVRADAPDLLVACPHYGEREVFVHHPDAVAWIQKLQAHVAAEEGWISPEQIPHLVAVQERLGAAQLRATLERLAAGLPVFDVHLEVSDEPTDDFAGPRIRVTSRGTVPAPNESLRGLSPAG